MRVIKGDKLKEMFISGSNNLFNHHTEIDALNVFPVPDGDTGTNINLTLVSGVKEINALTNKITINNVAKAFSKGLLMGARGNSGVITSQIFRGFAKSIENKKEINVFDLADAFESGANSAYKAVVKPVEGTILTVIREASYTLKTEVSSLMSIEKAMEILVKEAERSLKRTPELLPILKQVGVVDSGGAGLLSILKGMALAVEDKPVKRNEVLNDKGETPISSAGALLESDEFGYCTEFIMEVGSGENKKPFNETKFTETLSSKGNSLVVVKDENMVKVHVHTLTPGNILTYAQQFGEFLKLKIENMTEQHHALESGTNESSNEELIKEEKHEYALIGVSSGDGIDEFFQEIGINYIVKGGQTMNPSSEDFASAIKNANAKTIYIFPNNSNILMAATQACEMIDDKEVTTYIIPSKTILQGITSAVNFNSEDTPSNNFKNMKRALRNVKSGEITFSIRDSEINGLKIKKDDFIGIYDKDIVVAEKDKFIALLSLIDAMVDDSSALITLIYGEDINSDEALNIKKQINEKYPEIDIDLRSGKQPVYSFLVGVE